MAKEKNIHLFVLGVIGVVAVLGLVMMLTGDKTTGAIPMNQMRVSMYPNLAVYPDTLPQAPLSRTVLGPGEVEKELPAKSCPCPSGFKPRPECCGLSATPTESTLPAVKSCPCPSGFKSRPECCGL